MNLLASLLLVLGMSFSAFGKVTVSGFSSGGNFASQMHLAHSSWIEGAAIMAAGPYYCARGSSLDALFRCSSSIWGTPKIETLVEAAQALARAGALDPIENLKDDSVYVFLGRNDRVIKPDVFHLSQEFYLRLGVTRMLVEYTVPSGHGFPTRGEGNPCETLARPPFVSKCGRDIAGDILAVLYGDLRPAVAAPKERYFKIQQLKSPEAEEISLAPHAIAYVPRACEAALERCHLHVAFHGCEQTIPEVGDAYYRKTGFNGWAEANDIVVVYPQSTVNKRLVNPYGCWDWWGYTGDRYHTKQGPQIKAITQMLQKLRSGKINLEELSE